MKRPVASLVAALLLVGICALIVLKIRESQAPLSQVANLIRERVHRRELSFSKSDRSERARNWALVAEFYRKRSYRPAWSDGRGPDRQSRELAEALRAATLEGLNPKDYDVDTLEVRIKRLDRKGVFSEAPPAPALANLDLRLTYTYFQYANHLLNGRVSTATVDPDWITSPRDVDLVGNLQVATARHGVRRALLGLLPQDPDYHRLKDALVLYTGIEQEGGWGFIHSGPPLRLGRVDPRVPSLRARLRTSGDLSNGGRDRSFDRPLERAVMAFQTRHGLQPTGVVDPATLDALNVPVGVRVRQIQLNMARRRWLPQDLGKRYVVVNVPDFTLDVMEGPRSVLHMRVVVGKRGSPTPLFSDKITYVELNPYWNIPREIAKDEIVPLVREDKTYLEQNQIKVLSGPQEDAAEVDPSDVDWGKIGEEGDPYVLREEPGPTNPLGKIKFMCPNEHDVYLHDTPAGHLFSVKERDFSHGCIRVERPLDLAEYLLRGTADGSRDRVQALIDSGERKAIRLPEPVPVHVLYWTAWMDDRGLVQFRDDVYGHDRRLDEAIRTGTEAQFQINAPEKETKDSTR
ncbi:MAG TPA: L,D-transpeptidase family protein [Candidatus Dormibacteraeota bacterium]|nr:L,D-transpeptidase family protein [Candidatus Dormibacteraeota bacterium]